MQIKNSIFCIFFLFFILVVIIESKIIHLPYGVISEKKDPENELQFNFPPNFRKDILFDKLPYLTHSKNPTLNNIIKNGVVDNLGLQKYLLATGLLQDSVQQSCWKF